MVADMNAAPCSPLTQIPRSLICAEDYAERAPAHMTPEAWAFFSGAAGDESTHRRNRAAIERLLLQSRVLTAMQAANTAVTLFGSTYSHPILVAPIAYQRLAHPDGEIAMAMGSSAIGAGMVVSTQASASLASIAAATDIAPWFQLYMQPDRDHTLALIERAEQTGYGAIVVTLDAPINGVRRREHRAAFALPPDISAVNLAGMRTPAPHTARLDEPPLFGTPLLSAMPTWADLVWLRAQTALPLIVKGITAPDDALRALDVGANGIIVSNHGGRVLESQPGTFEQLPRIAKTLSGQATLLVDGGIQSGSAIVKALALGANAVLVGRPMVHALAVAGALGVAHLLHILRAELESTMVLTGCPTLEHIGPHVLFETTQ